VSEEGKLKALCKGVHAISSGFEIRFTASSDNSEQWCVTVGVRDVILFHTGFGTLDDILSLAISKLAGISQKSLVAIKNGDKEP
jgi:hypothetical protein